MVGKDLGQMKLEHIINKAVFLAPKVYGLIDTEGNQIIKVKGEITISDVAYTLKVTSNKRQAVYVNSIFDSTKPYYYYKIINK